MTVLSAYQSRTVLRQQASSFAEQNSPMCAFSDVGGHCVLCASSNVVDT